MLRTSKQKIGMLGLSTTLVVSMFLPGTTEDQKKACGWAKKRENRIRECGERSRRKGNL